MRTVGQILKEERERQYLHLEQVEKVTKIRLELLQALEADDYNKLPPRTFVQGFIKSYGKFLNLDPEKLLAIYRREFSDRKHPPRIMEALANPLAKPGFRITPAKLLSGIVISLILVFFAYLWFEYRFLVGAPYLEVNTPTDNITVTNPTIEVSGKTDSESKVEINNQEVTVDGNGNFTQSIKLSDNISKITVTATSKFGKNTNLERTVYLKQ